MSRLGKQPIEVPSGVSVSINGRKIAIAKGEQTLELEHRPEVTVAWDDSAKTITVAPLEGLESNRQARAYWGMTRSLLANMVEGVTKGYQKQLEVVGVGYTATVAGNKLQLKVGYANTISVSIPPGLDVAVDRQFINIKGADKQLVSEFAARVRSQRKPEPYNGKGIKYSDEVIHRKQGKAFGS